jgi:hypothetical protein
LKRDLKVPIDKTKNPWIITPIFAATVQTGRNVKIHGVRVVGVNNNESMDIIGSTGNFLYEFIANTNDYTEESKMQVWARRSFTAAVTQSGTVYIYLEEGA